MTTINLIRNADDAFRAINAMLDCDCNETMPRTRDCLHTHAARSLRDLLIDRDADAYTFFDDDAPLASPIHDFIRAMLACIDAAEYQTDRLSTLALDNSLCPLHFIDYAICFDDDDPDCAQIRSIFPSHDT